MNFHKTITYYINIYGIIYIYYDYWGECLVKIKRILMYVIIILVLLIVLIYALKNTESNKEIADETKELFINTQSELVNVNKYIVYGTHLNIYGKLDINLEDININDVNLVLKNIQGKEISFKVEYDITENSITFNTSDEINDGINLEEIAEGHYYMLLKIDSNINEVNYYLLDNTTEYENIEYYTITKNNKNNKINIDTEEYLLDGITVPYMSITVKENKLPDEIYDIVIDPGHGGNDSGAVKDNYTESEITLEYCLELKDKLEELGLKVKLVRETDEYIDAYGEEGRAVIPNKVKAKYVFSVHLNSSEYTMKTGGVEVYSPSNCNLYFAKLIADNIVDIADTTYSPNMLYKVQDGVYVRNYIEQEITEANEYADELDYDEYDITTATPYMFMIRETGGIATNAYIDGRNTNYGINKYYNSNMGSEGYLLELGFMTCSDDLNNIVNNKNSYVEAITRSIQEYLKITN